MMFHLSPTIQLSTHITWERFAIAENFTYINTHLKRFPLNTLQSCRNLEQMKCWSWSQMEKENHFWAFAREINIISAFALIIQIQQRKSLKISKNSLNEFRVSCHLRSWATSKRTQAKTIHHRCMAWTWQKLLQQNFSGLTMNRKVMHLWDIKEIGHYHSSLVPFKKRWDAPIQSFSIRSYTDASCGENQIQICCFELKFTKLTKNKD